MTDHRLIVTVVSQRPWEGDGLGARIRAAQADELSAPGTDEEPWLPFDPELDSDCEPAAFVDDDRLPERAGCAVAIALLTGLFVVVIGRLVRRTEAK